jgi:isoaspartyl peptidase/L-asparaginase-like protein (Ntn-hydrolase superfamily)
MNKIKVKQRDIHYSINRLVNQNQIYRVSTYITGKENAIDVPKDIVGTVALVWFGSLAFICSLAGVFLAIAGIYIQKIYSPAYIAKELEELERQNA